MFDVAKDRLSYGELLRPDVGYRLDFAVGMTYSLDLEALLGVPISVGLLEEGDEEQMRSPLSVLEAIRDTGELKKETEMRLKELLSAFTAEFSA